MMGLHQWKSGYYDLYSDQISLLVIVLAKQSKVTNYQPYKTCH